MRLLLIISMVLPASLAAADKAADAVLLLDEGVKLYNAGELQAARDAFRGARDLEPDKPNPYRWLGLVDVKLGRCSDATRELQLFLEKVPATDPRVTEAKQARDQCRQTEATASSPPAASVAALTGQIARGPEHAPVTLLEFSNFDCSACARMQATLKQVAIAYPNQLRIVWKNQPLTQPRPLLAAEAALAANEEGKFWPFHDKLFANPMQLDRATLQRYASELGLNLARFNQAIDTQRFASRIADDQAELARRDPYAGAPVFFVNGHRVPGAQPTLEAFKKMIDAELTRFPLLVK